MNAEQLLMGWSCISLSFQYVGMSGCPVLTEKWEISEPQWKQLSFEICTSTHSWEVTQERDAGMKGGPAEHLFYDKCGKLREGQKVGGSAEVALHYLFLNKKSIPKMALAGQGQRYWT